MVSEFICDLNSTWQDNLKKFYFHWFVQVMLLVIAEMKMNEQ